VKTGETYTCIGDNQFQEETGLRHDQMIGVVTSFSRGERSVSVSNFAYRLYCRVWHYSRPVRHFLRRVKNRLRRMFK
jgi:hypothetical protein